MTSNKLDYEGERNKDSKHMRIEQIANGFLFRPGGKPTFCKDEEELQKKVQFWVKMAISGWK